MEVNRDYCRGCNVLDCSKKPGENGGCIFSETGFLSKVEASIEVKNSCKEVPLLDDYYALDGSKN